MAPRKRKAGKPARASNQPPAIRLTGWERQQIALQLKKFQSCTCGKRACRVCRDKRAMAEEDVPANCSADHRHPIVQQLEQQDPYSFALGYTKSGRVKRILDEVDERQCPACKSRLIFVKVVWYQFYCDIGFGYGVTIKRIDNLPQGDLIKWFESGPKEEVEFERDGELIIKKGRQWKFGTIREEEENDPDENEDEEEEMSEDEAEDVEDENEDEEMDEEQEDDEEIGQKEKKYRRRALSGEPMEQQQRENEQGEEQSDENENQVEDEQEELHQEPVLNQQQLDEERWNQLGLGDGLGLVGPALDEVDHEELVRDAESQSELNEEDENRAQRIPKQLPVHEDVLNVSEQMLNEVSAGIGEDTTRDGLRIADESRDATPNREHGAGNRAQNGTMDLEDSMLQKAANLPIPERAANAHGQPVPLNSIRFDRVAGPPTLDQSKWLLYRWLGIPEGAAGAQIVGGGPARPQSILGIPRTAIEGVKRRDLQSVHAPSIAGFSFGSGSSAYSKHKGGRPARERRKAAKAAKRALENGGDGNGVKQAESSKK